MPAEEQNNGGNDQAASKAGQITEEAPAAKAMTAPSAPPEDNPSR